MKKPKSYILNKHYSNIDLNKKIRKDPEESNESLNESLDSSFLSSVGITDGFSAFNIRDKSYITGIDELARENLSSWNKVSDFGQAYNNSINPWTMVGVPDMSSLTGINESAIEAPDWGKVASIDDSYLKSVSPLSAIGITDVTGIGESAEKALDWSRLSDIDISTSISDPFKLSEISKVNLTANSLVGQVSILQEETNLSPLLEEISKSAKIISDYTINSNENFLNSPITTKAFINRLNKLPQDYHLMIPQSKEEDAHKDVYLKNESKESKISLSGTVSSFGVLDLVTSLTEKEVMDFYNYLSEFPMLGLNHEVGRKILEWITEAPLTTIDEDTIHYRARLRPLGQERPLTQREMWEAPYGLPGQGRFNIIGENFLYTSDLASGAACEISKEKTEGKIDIVRWTLRKKVKLLDMAKKDYPLLRYCQFSSTSETEVKPEYLIPNFIAQCCVLNGIAGLRFVNKDQPDSYNYAFFDFLKAWFEFDEMISDYSVAWQETSSQSFR